MQPWRQREKGKSNSYSIEIVARMGMQGFEGPELWGFKLSFERLHQGARVDKVSEPHRCQLSTKS